MLEPCAVTTQARQKFHPDKNERARYRKIQRAIEKPDDKECRCKGERVKLGDVEIEVPVTFVSEMIYSPAHGDVVGLEVCKKCPAMNARPLRGVHATAAANTGKGKHDTEILKVA